jgi:hypothetical protein
MARATQSARSRASASSFGHSEPQGAVFLATDRGKVAAWRFGSNHSPAAMFAVRPKSLRKSPKQLTNRLNKQLIVADPPVRLTRARSIASIFKENLIEAVCLGKF